VVVKLFDNVIVHCNHEGKKDRNGQPVLTKGVL